MLTEDSFLAALLSAAHSSCFNRKNNAFPEHFVAIRLKNSRNTVYTLEHAKLILSLAVTE
jgi:hypothetical protein